MATLTIAQALNQALDAALTDLDDVLVMGEDIGRTGGVFRITDGLRDRHGPQRVVDTPLAESGIVGVGLGLALAGIRPVMELQFMGFSYPAFDQIISHVSRMRHRSRHRFTAPLVIRMPYGGGIGAAEHHSESTEALYAHIPGLKVVVPSRPGDAAGLLRAAIEDPDPVIFLEPIRLYRSVKEELPDLASVPLGSAAVERHGTDITLIAWGAMMKETREAAEKLAASGISAEVVDVRSLAPLDITTIAASVSKTGRAVVIHEAPRTAGLGAEIIAQLQEHCAYDLEAPVKRVTGWDTVVPLKMSEQHYTPSLERILAATTEVLES
ncbi:alpha-ketoacid dehydrogenase subunit beta [Kribbella shirazensis]|uniref:Pyruvate dehydrogenase E1 component beta subunit n=1 Tax=Kribbella shirazensis TaxID=1105143 RepID=A0A7X5VHP5_9ACTN|nr:alpha-ketoacid dehydrogenase subunit beta [Kribbella shirazensis]NIK61434.1 pyruvate dehydrogenase E1 component beta subunit [Kribbella shirazensis]